MRFRYLVPLLLAAPGRSSAQTPPDSQPTYSSAALQALVARASRRNTVVPRGLKSYAVVAESELSLVVHRADGTEGATQIEQVASDAQWFRTGAFRQHIIGYRAELAGPNISALGLIRQAWIVPVLYGNRLGLFLGRDSVRAARRTIARDTAVRVVHPFAIDRDSVYRFTGGDTAVVLVLEGRRIPVAVVHVVPRPGQRRRAVLFRGEVYLDVNDATIVRMRGAFEVVGGHRKLLAEAESFAYSSAAFVDLTNRLVAGRYWLPDEQRIEGEVSSPFLGDSRSVFRIMTHFGPYVLNDTTAPPETTTLPPVALSPVAPLGAELPGIRQRTAIDSAATDTARASDTMRVLPHVLSIGPADSLRAFAGWRQPMGAATRSVQDSDFKDVAPNEWRSVGRPEVLFGVQSLGDFLHFDRVEGLYTGAGGAIRFRDAAPGLIVRAHGGWAWTEGTARGGASTEWVRGTWLLGVQAARALDITNDFTTVYTSGPFLEPLVVQDNYDYVDHRSATAYIAHEWFSDKGVSQFVLRVEGGPESDKGDRARLRHGIFPPSLFMSDSLFRPNRNVLAGSYGLGVVTLEYNPGIDAGFVGEGFGARVRYEAAGGQLAWERVDTRLVARHAVGAFTTFFRLDGGVVEGTVIPPQQLFQIGSVEGLLAYNYKQFAGNEVVIGQGEELYRLPLWQGPLHIHGLFLPGPSPGLAFGFQDGWTDLGNLAARRALLGLGARVNPATDAVLRDAAGVPLPASEPTNGVRTSLDLLVRFFGGAIGVGVARSLDPGATVQAVFRVGAAM